MLYVIALLLVHLVYGQATLTLLTNAVQDGAVCLDGSAAAYYYRPGTGDVPRNGSFITKVAVSVRPLGIATVVQPVVSGPQRVTEVPWILVADISLTMLRKILSCTTGTWFFFPIVIMVSKAVHFEE